MNQDSLRSLKPLFECMSCVSVEMHLDVSSLLSVFNLRLQAGSRYTPRPADPSCQAVCIGEGGIGPFSRVCGTGFQKKYNKGIS